MRLRSLAPAVILLATLTAAAADEAPTTGHVQIPVEVYNRLVEIARDPARSARPAPAGYALGNARVTLSVAGAAARTSVEVRVDLTIDVLEDQWVLVPVLPAGTPVDAARRVQCSV